MKAYNFEIFTNGRGEEMLSVLTSGVMAETTEETLANAGNLAKRIFSAELVEFIDLSKEEFTSDYIRFEAGLKGEAAEDMYNQIAEFIKSRS